MDQAQASADDLKLFRDLQGARIRVGLMALFHILFPPVASIVYSIKARYFKPLIIATVVGLFTSTISSLVVASPEPPLASKFIVAIGLGFIPPLISFLLLEARVKILRDRHGIRIPEQADRLLEKLIESMAGDNQH